CRGYRRNDAAAGARDLLITRALETELELMRTVAAIDEMGVTVDEAGRNPASLAIDPIDRVGIDREIRLRARINDMTIARGDQTALDLAEIGTIGPQGCEPGIVPDPVEALCHAVVPSRWDA